MDACSSFGGKFTNSILIPQRYLLVIMVSLSTFCAYSMRASFGVAIQEMSVKTNTTVRNSTDYCPETGGKSDSVAQNLTDKYAWSSSAHSAIKVCFFWGYMFTHLPGAMLAEKIGGKYVLGCGMFYNFVLCVITPIVIIRTGGVWGYVAGIYLLWGFGHGLILPVTTGLLGHWIPAENKCFMASLLYSGGLLGIAFTYLVGREFIAIRGHWDILFYIFGVTTFVWTIAWQIFCYSFPDTNPCIKIKEKEYLDEKLVDVSTKRLETPIKEMLSSVHVWALIIAQLGNDWGWYTMFVELPIYMSNVLKYSLQEATFYTSVPWCLNCIGGVCSGWMADFLVRKEWLSVLRVRRIFGSIGHVIPGMLMVAAAYSGCNTNVGVTCLAISSFFMGFFFSGMKVNALDLSPNFAGSVIAIANGLGAVVVTLCPVIIGWIAPDRTLTQWTYIFWTAFVWLVGSDIFYVIFLSVDVQPWNYHQDLDVE